MLIHLILNEILEKQGCEDDFFKFIAYILLSIGICTLILAGITAIVKKETNKNCKYKPIISYILFLFG